MLSRGDRILLGAIMVCLLSAGLMLIPPTESIDVLKALSLTSAAGVLAVLVGKIG